ncbi:MAG: multiheme c-type cytochrome [Gammaproteobacteria bacterium]|jgi:hypothetical protein|nr:multiheme c-type cytochrome [Gammaproteobacteria bacterium]MDH3862793.1 multiheme c-type cytochrome [Gammaproteobacteria bacterium]MDH3906457.1 multiheme c-type cytochrome [Gammaproteobacteria bacterium]MDH4005600.1 multiheme c-type cytochrome [Gammaproteobacteria bacterium]NCF60854.1 hypothetical protein [Gammaproteobacteria bacterium]
MDNKQEHNSTPGEVVIDYRSFLTWIVTAVVAYSLLSGLMVTFLPFGVYAQFSIIIHTVVGLVAVIPLVAAVYLHWQRRKSDAPVPIARAAIVAVVALFVCVLTGLIITAMAVFGTWVPGWVDTVHLVSALVLGTLIAIHLAPIVARYGNAEASPRRAPRKRFVGTGVAIIAVLFAVTGFLSRAQTGPDQFQAFSDDYNWPHGDDRAFWPSRIAIANTPWLNRFLADVEKVVGAERAEDFGETLRGPQDAGLRAQTAEIVAALELDPDAASAVDDLVERAIVEQKQSGSLKPSALAGSATCGSSGCHQSIYKEWRASAHGFAAEDILFLQVQDLLIKEKGAAESRACAGCHDPAALLGGTRHEGLPQGSELPIFEANSCITCHSTIETDTNGNGGYVIQAPERYLFEERDAGLAGLAAKFLIRAYPEKHVAEYKRPLYKTSEFCAACHKQVPPPGEATTAGLAQEQNEYDSWRSGRFYHGKDHPDTIECLECHMPLVDSDDPARGDDVDSYRSPNDGKHRSHRVLASNMYIPATMDIPGGDEQAELTIKWLRGEIEVPEIADKWTTGPTVEMQIDAPESIRAGDLVNIQLHLHNNKTGHDFPAGPLDVLESWIELTVEDNLGNKLMELGADRSISPSIDAPVVYKADWYDSQGLPVERHNLWDVVGASYKRVIQSGGSDVVDVPFRCPGIARPRLSDSASEDTPGERKSDVVFAINNAEFTELHVTARLLFRKANPEFLAKVYDVEEVPEAPVVEIVRATHTIRVE